MGGGDTPLRGGDLSVPASRAGGPHPDADGSGRRAPPPDRRGRPLRHVAGGGHRVVRVDAPRGGAGGLRRACRVPLPGLRRGAAVAHEQPDGEPDRPRQAPDDHDRGRPAQLQVRPGEGPEEDPVQDGHLPAQLLPRRADFRDLRPGRRRRRPVLQGLRVAHRRHVGRRPAARGRGVLGQGVPGEGHKAAGELRLHPVPHGPGVPRQQPGDGQVPAQGHRPGRQCQGRGGLPRLHGPLQELPRPRAARHARVQVRPEASAGGRGGAGRGHHAAVLHGGHVARGHLPGDARDDRGGHEPHRRQVQLRGGRGGPRAVGGAVRRGRRGPLPAAPAPQGAPERRRGHVQDQAGRVGALRRHAALPGQRRPARDQDRPGGQAGRGRAAAGQEGLDVHRVDAQVQARRAPHLAAPAPRHLLHRGPRPGEALEGAGSSGTAGREVRRVPGRLRGGGGAKRCNLETRGVSPIAAPVPRPRSSSTTCIRSTPTPRCRSSWWRRQASGRSRPGWPRRTPT